MLKSYFTPYLVVIRRIDVDGCHIRVYDQFKIYVNFGRIVVFFSFLSHRHL